MPKLYSRIDENVLRHNITNPLLILIKKLITFGIFLIAAIKAKHKN